MPPGYNIAHGLLQKPPEYQNPRLTDDEDLRSSIGSLFIESIVILEEIDILVNKHSTSNAPSGSNFGSPFEQTIWELLKNMPLEAAREELVAQIQKRRGQMKDKQTIKRRLQWAFRDRNRFQFLLTHLEVFRRTLQEKMPAPSDLEVTIDFPWNLLPEADDIDKLDELESLLLGTNWHDVGIAAGVRKQSIQKSPNTYVSPDDISNMDMFLPARMLRGPPDDPDIIDRQNTLMKLHYGDEDTKVHVEWHYFGDGRQFSALLLSCAFVAKKLHLANGSSLFNILPFKGCVNDVDKLRFGYVFILPPIPNDNTTTLALLFSQSKAHDKEMQDAREAERKARKEASVKNTTELKYPGVTSATYPNAEGDIVAEYSSFPKPTIIPDTRPTNLAHKYTMAKCLARTLHHLLVSRWLHKSVRSSNIYFLNCPGAYGGGSSYYNYENPFLQGFTFSREDHKNATTYHDPDISFDDTVYQHPRYRMRPNSVPQRRVPSSRGGKLHPSAEQRIQHSPLRPPNVLFEPLFDIYSLGIVLMEVGFWKSAINLKIMDTNGNDNAKRFEVCYESLEETLGGTYRNAVEACINLSHKSTLSRDEIRKQFKESVLLPLESIQGI
ncbi:hypothetical protein ABW20_dc0108493 [Dactylellina cionopaga]|nr:hypothetical protein ABW20_dc0108493 [Dactylellina cionopaga]